MSLHDRIECWVLAAVSLAVACMAFYRAVMDGEPWFFFGCGIALAVAGALVGRALK